MSSFLATLLVLMMFVAVVAPATISFLRGAVTWRTSTFYGLLAVGVFGYYLGFLPRFGPMKPSTPGVQPQNATRSQCEQALGTAERGRIIIDRSNPRRIVVAGELWNQVPEAVREALIDCARSTTGEEVRTEDVEIVVRG